MREKITDYDPMIIRVNYIQKVRCIHCLSKEIYNKDKFERLIKYSNKDLVTLLGVSTSTIERCYHELYRSENKEFSSRLVPRALGIDEHSFSKRAGYATIFCNLIFDVVKGKSAKDLEDYLSKLQGRGRGVR